MASFFGTDADELVAPGAVAPTVTVIPGPSGATEPSADVDLFDMGGGNDTAVGFRGDDIAFMGDGNDIFFWAPGDGSDVVEGDGGTDTLGFLGGGVAEVIDVSAVGPRVLFVRDIADIKMNLDNVETVQFLALGGEDKINLRDLSGTDVTLVELELEGTSGSGVGDGVKDTVTVTGTDGDDTVNVTVSGTQVQVSGLPAAVTIDNADAGLDELMVSAGAGNDAIRAALMPAASMLLVLDGGDGNDTIFGGAGNDTIFGGAGNDTTGGLKGNDLAFLGSGNDNFGWAPGDGNDTVEGGAGFDALVFIGSGVDENIDISASGDRAIFVRDVAAVTMDLNNVERIEFDAFAGRDNILVRDLSGTDVRQVFLDLESAFGSGTSDLQADSVTVQGTAGNDSMDITFAVSTVSVTGLPADVEIARVDAGLDSLSMELGDGNDLVDGSSMPASAILLTLIGDGGNDTIRGGAGADSMGGGDGDDLVQGNRGGDLVHGGSGRDMVVDGAGNDTIGGGSGSDTVTSGAGSDNIRGGGGADLFVFQVVTDGTADLDRVFDYDGAKGDTVHLVGAGVASSSVVGSDLVVTLDNGDGDQIRFFGVSDVTDLIFV